MNQDEHPERIILPPHEDDGLRDSALQLICYTLLTGIVIIGIIAFLFISRHGW